MVTLTDADGYVGHGECSALNRAGYTDEWARGAFDHLLATGAGADDPQRARHPMARAAVEMAQLDLELRRDGQSLAGRLGVAADAVPAGVVGPLGDIDSTVAAAVGFAEQGYRRLKLKITPVGCEAIVAAVRGELPDIELQLDANASFAPVDLDALVRLAALGVRAVEQPFAPHDLDSAAVLVSATDMLVVADEAATDLEAVRRLVDRGACSAVSIKPPRLGGIGAAVAVHDWCVANGVPATAGGMLEGGLGRHALAAVAALPGFTLAGDVSPARRWLAADPWDDIGFDRGTIPVPSGPGVAPLPDPAALDSLTVRRAVLPR